MKGVVSLSRKDWSIKFDDALWAYTTAFKKPIIMSHYKIVFGKVHHLPFELEYEAYWAIQKLNFDAKACGEKMMLQVNELDKLRLNAYENAKLYKKRIKLWDE